MRYSQHIYVIDYVIQINKDIPTGLKAYSIALKCKKQDAREATTKKNLKRKDAHNERRRHNENWVWLWQRNKIAIFKLHRNTFSPIPPKHHRLVLNLNCKFWYVNKLLSVCDQLFGAATFFFTKWNGKTSSASYDITEIPRQTLFYANDFFGTFFSLIHAVFGAVYMRRAEIMGNLECTFQARLDSVL